jgi:hypothetical protein
VNAFLSLVGMRLSPEQREALVVASQKLSLTPARTLYALTA